MSLSEDKNQPLKEKSHINLKAVRVALQGSSGPPLKASEPELEL